MIPPRTTAHAVPTIVRQTPWNAEKEHGTFRKTAARVNTFGSIIMDKAMGFMEDVPDILTGKTCPWRISFCTSSVPVPTSSATEWAERQASREYWPCWRKGESSHSGSFNERLSREFGLDLIQTAPNVTYDVTAEDGSQHHVTNPSEFPDGKIKKIVEPMVAADIITPKEFIGAVMDLCQDHRGIMGTMEYISTDRVEMHYRIPLAEIVFDFFDQLKSRTKGYASLDYHEDGEQSADLVKVDILIQGEKVDAFSAIVHRDKAYSYGVMMTKKLRSLIPRQQFEIPIQAAIGSRIIARENIRALRKDVLAKCYGGDITRKRKLLEKQKAGKKRMKMLGHVEVPQEAFIAALSTGEDSNDRDTKDKIRAAQKTEG